MADETEPRPDDPQERIAWLYQMLEERDARLREALGPDMLSRLQLVIAGDHVAGDKITVGDITHSQAVAVGRGAQAVHIENLFLIDRSNPALDPAHSADLPIDFYLAVDDAVPEMKRVVDQVLAHLPEIGRPWVVEATRVACRAKHKESQDDIARSRAFVMFLGSDVNGWLQEEQARAEQAGVPRLCVVCLPEGSELDPDLQRYLKGEREAGLKSCLPGELVRVPDAEHAAEQVVPYLARMSPGWLNRSELVALLKWAIGAYTLYRLGKDVLLPIVQALAAPETLPQPRQAGAAGPGIAEPQLGPNRPPSVQAGDAGAVQSRRSLSEPEPVPLPSGQAGPAGATDPAQPRQPSAETVPTPPLRRTASGLVVADAGSLRHLLALPDPPRRVWWEPAGLELCLVPAGEFLMGTREDEIPALIREFGEWSGYERETPQHALYLPSYYIGRFPVTKAQYARFVEATGYDVPHVDWDRARRAPPPGKEEHPVVDVRWADALAYCRWAGLALPSEAEWEKAASWDPAARRKRRYPWGDGWDAARCNTSEGGQGGTTPAGSYSPRGDSAYGCADMAGNVWEWTRSLWGRSWDRMDFGYPYDPLDGRENLAAEGARVVGGGSWSSGRDSARCAYRRIDLPDFSLDYLGFRCCVSPISPSGF